MNSLETKALEFLEKADKSFYVDMTDPIRHGFAEVRYADDDGVVILIDRETWMSAALNDESALKMARLVKQWMNPEEEGYCIHGDLAIKEICALFGPDSWTVPCYVCTCLRDRPYIIDTPLEFRKLDHSFDSFVHLTYNFTKDKPDGINYARSRIEAGVYGGFLDGKCVGFIGTHGEGTIGLLEVLPEFRRRGFGEALEKNICNEMMKIGRTPYCHVLTNNTASLRLQADMGMWVSSGAQKVHWLH